MSVQTHKNSHVPKSRAHKKFPRKCCRKVELSEFSGYIAK